VQDVSSLLFNSRFLFHYLDFNYEYIRGASQGSNQQALNSSVVSGLNVAYPPPNEQNHIATIIDVYDNCIDKEETYLEKIKRQKVGLMQDLLTGKVRVTPLLEKEPASR
jgi:type I restriction enzyme, S subunit